MNTQTDTEEVVELALDDLTRIAGGIHQQLPIFINVITAPVEQ